MNALEQVINVLMLVDALTVEIMVKRKKKTRKMLRKISLHKNLVIVRNQNALKNIVNVLVLSRHVIKIVSASNAKT